MDIANLRKFANKHRGSAAGNFLHLAADEISRLRAELEAERTESAEWERLAHKYQDERNQAEARVRELETPTAFAVRNDQGYWVGIWNDREMAEHVLSKLPPSGNEAIIPVKALANNAKE